MPVTRASATQTRINAVLGRLGASASTEIRVRLATVDLSVEREIPRLGHDHEQRLRTEELADRTQQYEFNRLRHFRDTVFSDPAAAMSYWFMNHPDHLDDSTYAKIEKLVEKLADHDPRMSWLHVARILDIFVKDLSPEDKHALLELITTNMTKFGHRAGAEQLATIFDTHHPGAGVRHNASTHIDDIPRR